jgi:CRISPR-associated endonuclease Csn1
VQSPIEVKNSILIKKLLVNTFIGNLQRNPHTTLKNQVFYRQDYLDEFEAIWNEQSKHHNELTVN